MFLLVLMHRSLTDRQIMSNWPFTFGNSLWNINLMMISHFSPSHSSPALCRKLSLDTSISFSIILSDERIKTSLEHKCTQFFMILSPHSHIHVVYELNSLPYMSRAYFNVPLFAHHTIGIWIAFSWWGRQVHTVVEIAMGAEYNRFFMYHDQHEGDDDAAAAAADHHHICMWHGGATLCNCTR